MDITCHNCKTTYEAPAGAILSARLKYALGYQEYAFTCPNCGAKNGLTKDKFHSQDHPQNVVPVTSARSQPGPADSVPQDTTRGPAGRAPTNPVEGPGTDMQQYKAVVRVRGVEARRDHSNWSEIMGAFSKGDTIPIVGTWSDGENTWVQLGPERWVNIEQDGEPVLELID